MSKEINRRRKWFDGIRLSTWEQNELARRALDDTETRFIGTGDTLVQVRDGFLTCYRQDWSIQLTEKEYRKRKWLEPEAV